MNDYTGLFGGTFNPVHNGHIDLGLRLTREFPLGRVLYILSARPPHKNREVVTAPLRWKMLKKALSPYPALVPSDIEMRSSHPSWTVNTIKKLKKTHTSSRLVFISGSEGFLQIQSWKDYRDLLREIPFLIILREPSHLDGIRRIARDEKLTTGKSFRENRHLLVYHYQSPTSDLSSTRIRKRLRAKISVTSLVPPAVNKIIKEYKLYEP